MSRYLPASRKHSRGDFLQVLSAVKLDGGPCESCLALVVIAGLVAFLIFHNLALWTYAERHGVREELQRLADKNRSR